MTQTNPQQACRKWIAARGKKDHYLGRRDQQPEVAQQLALLGENLERLEKDLGSRLQRLLDEAKTDLDKVAPAIAEATQALQAIFDTLDQTPHNPAANQRAAKEIDKLTLRLSRRMRPRLVRAIDRLAPEYKALEKPLNDLDGLRIHAAKPVDEYLWILRAKRKGVETDGKSLFELMVEPRLDAFCQTATFMAWRYQVLKWRCHREFDFTHLPLGAMALECLTERSGLEPAKLIQQHQEVHAELKGHLVGAWQSIRFNLETASSELDDIAEELRAGKTPELEGRSAELCVMVMEVLDKCLPLIEEVPAAYAEFIAALLDKIEADHAKALAVIQKGVETPNTLLTQLRWWAQAQRRHWHKWTVNRQWRLRDKIDTWKESPAQLGRVGQWFFSRLNRFERATPIKESLLKLSDIPSEAELLEQAKSLPPIYRRLFQNAPLYNREFMVGMDEELALLEQTYARWRAGKAASVAVIGPEGSGKTSLLNCFANELEEDAQLLRATIRHRLVTAADVIGMIEDVLAIEEPSDSVADLIGKILKMGPRVVLIEDGHQLFLRSVGARVALETFFYIMMSTRSQLFWVLTFRLNPWRRISYMHQAERYFTHVIKSEFHSEAEMREALLIRQRIAGQAPVYCAEGITAYKLRKLLSQHQLTDKPVQQALMDLYFSNLYALSGGNMQTALYYWLRSLSIDEQGVMKIMPCAKVDTGFIKGLDPLYLLTLTEVLAHGGLTPREHSEIFNLEDLRSRLILDYLRQIRLLKGSNEDRRGQYQSYIVNPIFFQPISSTLTAMHYLY